MSKTNYYLLGLVFFALIGMAVLSQFLSLKNSFTLILVLLTIGLWASGVIAEYLTALIFFTVAIILKLASPEVIFSGFISSSFWFIFAGLIISLSIEKSGLGVRVSYYLSRLFKRSYAIVIVGMVIFGIIMSFVMPSAMGRMVLMTPILIDFARRLGYDEKSKGYSGIVLSGIFGSYFSGSAILSSNIPNIILTGSMESLYHMTPGYGQYFLLHFPVLGLLKSILLVVVILKLFPDNSVIKKPAANGIVPCSRHERNLTFYLLISLVLWMTDFIHHISPAWVGLAIGTLCLCPKIGIIDAKEFMRKTNFAPLFYVAGIIGLSAVINCSGLGTIMAKNMLAVLPFSIGHNIMNFSLLALLSTLIGVLTTSPGVPGILTPLAVSISSATNLPLITVLMTQVLGFSTFILPYQAPPIVVAAQLGGISFKETSKLCLITAGLTIFLLFPADYFWWRVIGAI